MPNSKRVQAAMRAAILDLLSLPPEELRRQILEMKGGELATMLMESGMFRRMGIEYPEIEGATPSRRSWWRRASSHISRLLRL